jgi:hypothetical protein
LSCPRPKEDDCDATPKAPNAIVAVAAIAYFGVKYFLNEVDSSFVFLFSKVVDSMVSLLEVIIVLLIVVFGVAMLTQDFLFFLRQLLKKVKK